MLDMMKENGIMYCDGVHVFECFYAVTSNKYEKHLKEYHQCTLYSEAYSSNWFRHYCCSRRDMRKEERSGVMAMYWCSFEC